MNIESSKITHQLKGNCFSYDKSIHQQIHYKLLSTTTGKYNNSLYINEFINFLKIHVFQHSESNENENRFSKLNIPMLYLIFIIKNYEYPNFHSSDINNTNYRDKINELLKNIIRMDKDESYMEYAFDIIRYLYIYNLIANDKYISL
ncbi:hypothetical protein BCR36DRAFT_468370 [Piromyces finnis]|uniref:Uncharacterized protein n=1 Tax=Piromyces finnis TaxID=1754191 RepID=A0A1Y1UTS1_9FUNG|nr:hypothetical protein BCR36DRAFT_468370 [Piromyces finnis]|eukprot:ORX41411.1 hypothetical protein BCR36DRAFT_468370 [Piromyces finnis]